MIEHGRLAEELFHAQETRTPVALLTERFPQLTWDDARRVATETDALRSAAGHRQIGWKLGWTSAAMRESLGIDQPNWGTLWHEQLAGAEYAIDRLIHPKVEPELVWKAPHDVEGSVAAEDIRSLGGQWALGIEVVDPRFPSFDFQALDNTADNSSSAAARIGEFARLDGDPALLEVEFSNGTVHRSGLGSQAMDSPYEAVAWLVRSLAEEGLGVRREDIVMTGGVCAPFDVARGSTYSVSCPGLAATTLSFR